MRFVKPYKFLLVLTIIIGILKFAIPLFLPWLLQVILDDVLLNETLSTDEKTKLLFTWIGIALVLFFVVRPPIEYYRQYFAQNLSNNILFDIRKELYGHLQRLSLKYYANTRAGEVISRVINDVEQTKNFVMTGLMNLWLDLVTIIIVVGIMLSMNVKLTLVSLIVLPFYAFSVKYFFGKLRSLTKDRSQALAGVQSYLHERVAGMSIIKSFTLEKHEQQIFDETNGEFLNKALAHSRWNAKSFAVVNTITEMAPLIVIGYAGYQYLNDALTIGVMVAFYAYIERLYGPLRRLVSSSTTLTQSIASMDRMFELMDEKYDVQNKENAIDLPQAKGKLQFENVSFQYDVDGKTILNEVDFMIEPGQTVAFVGMSGGGKSTVVSLIPRFYDASAGAVKIDDYDVKDVTLNSLRSQIGIVLQDNILFSDSVKQNILMGNPYATDDQVIAAAKAANAHDFIMSLPEGYDTKVGERGVKLSGGQKQRVAIARVFLKNPPILVLDEATSALDLESEALIQESLDRLAHDRTTIIIAHRLSTITHADKIFVIEHGEVSEAGTHDELMGKNGAYYNLFQVQKLD
ncbi:ABC transporter ATP-binding protein [Solibacillus daqui]|uniref:ABC transporter ATP-binding protein n=1 Tax=Solibacillus daqui TaxID=2912187 RepID=UPI002366C000|nr:ABC transporter ATP-binding protein [Solibacillus daqui]